MNNQGLLALAQLILPSEILSNFEVVRVEEEASLIRIYLDESVKAEYKENPEIEYHKDLFFRLSDADKPPVHNTPVL